MSTSETMPTEADLQTLKNHKVVLDYRMIDRMPEAQRISTLCSLDKNTNGTLILVRPKDIQALSQVLQNQNLTKVSYLTLPVTYSRLIQTLTQTISNQPNTSAKAEAADNVNVVSNEKTVLLVEDVAINQMVASAMLKKFGYTVVLANNGIEAVEAYKKQKFDLILMDCQMPEKDGYEATIEIRELEKQNHTRTPIIALTANAFREIKEKCFETGMDDFMTKPFKIEDLKQTLKRVMG